MKFKTYSSVFLNRFEALNLSLMQKMQNRKPVEVSHTPEPSAAAFAQAATAPKTPVATPGGGVKKKKPKKKK